MPHTRTHKCSTDTLLAQYYLRYTMVKKKKLHNGIKENTFAGIGTPTHSGTCPLDYK